MFTVYVNDTDFYLKYCNISKYADGIKLYQVIPNHNSLIETSMSQLCFNVSKCSILQFGHLNPSQLSTLNKDHIPAKSFEKDLGVAVSTDLKFTTHVTSAVKKAESPLAVLKRSTVSRNKSVCSKLYKTLVRPQLK